MGLVPLTRKKLKLLIRYSLLRFLFDASTRSFGNPHRAKLEELYLHPYLRDNSVIARNILVAKLVSLQYFSVKIKVTLLVKNSEARNRHSYLIL